MDKVRFTTILDKYTFNPIFKALAAIGITFPGVVILETIGRKSGRLRRMPVGARTEGSTLWVMAEHGRRNAYVRNIDANPSVRVRVRGYWYSGTAHVMPEDDPEQRLDEMVKGKIGLKIVEGVTRMSMTDPLTVRIDLDRPPGSG